MYIQVLYLTETTISLHGIEDLIPNWFQDPNISPFSARRRSVHLLSLNSYTKTQVNEIFSITRKARRAKNTSYLCALLPLTRFIVVCLCKEDFGLFSSLFLFFSMYWKYNLCLYEKFDLLLLLFFVSTRINLSSSDCVGSMPAPIDRKHDVLQYPFIRSLTRSYISLLFLLCFFLLCFCCVLFFCFLQILTIWTSEYQITTDRQVNCWDFVAEQNGCW